ncbi:MAG: squalene--hopene cyclase [Deltaproteobacteria bacterium]|jgi:squalene-hopene/tetraprenyl-beta-curcumene cyclase|nr:squalene--hopene cyclase [Deltaproteobacteria bacterium]
MNHFENVGASVESAEGEEERGVGDGESGAEGMVFPEPHGPLEELCSHRSRSPAIIRSSWVPQIEETIRKSCEYFFKTQYPEGYWWSELESNVTITAEYVMLARLLGVSLEKKKDSIVKYFLGHQDENGAWGLYYGDGGELSTTIEAYFALKLLGQDPASDALARARGFILQHGGIEDSRVFTKIWLAQFGQYEWKKIPSMPVELVLLTPEFYFNIYEFSSWARGTVVPLSIVLCIRPKFELPESLSISELCVPEHGKRLDSRINKLFFVFDRIAKKLEKRPIRKLRRRAIEAAKNWIVDHQEESGDWGGIQPPMVYSMLALHYLGFPLSHEVMKKGLKAIEDFCLEDAEGFRMQSCISPVWDTALTVMALTDAGVGADHPALEKSAKWLMDQQILTGGDWQFKNRCRPGGWAFEFYNSRYPDVDDSAVVLNVLNRFDPKKLEGLETCKSRGMEWLISMQSSNGGWAAFDRDNNMEALNRIPFADTEAMVDPPTADVTGRVIEVMGCWGYEPGHRAARRGIAFLKRIQEKDGSWWGRWGVNYIYGTWSVLRGLICMGEDPKAPVVRAAMHWLKDHQNPDGGWGETCASYEQPELSGQGPSTASQTAWAIMALLAGGEERSPEVSKGVMYLLRNQKPDGSWDEIYFTGTGFPGHFYIRYHNYRNCFPLMALGQYLMKLRG